MKIYELENFEVDYADERYMLYAYLKNTNQLKEYELWLSAFVKRTLIK